METPADRHPERARPAPAPTLEELMNLVIEFERLPQAEQDRAYERHYAQHPDDRDAMENVRRGGSGYERQVAHLDPTLPATLGPFQTIRRLGNGGMGEVFAALDPKLQRVVALKLGFARSTDVASERFARERRILAALNHPNIASIYDAGELGDRSYFTMELIESGTITEYANANRLGIEPRIDLFLQVCEAVRAAHQAGVIHRDLKPSNVLVSKSDIGAQAKVIDFGLAKDEERDQLTASGELVGTLSYMAPEQILRSRMADARSDIYALGVLLYELLTGAPPNFAPQTDPPLASHRLDQTQQHAQAMRIAPRAVTRRLRGDLDEILRKALERNPDERYQSADRLIEDLLAERNSGPVSANHRSGWRRLRKFARRHRAMIASTLLLSGAGLAFLVNHFAWSRRAAGNLAEGTQLAEYLVIDMRNDLVQAGRYDVIQGVAERVESFFGGIAGQSFPYRAARVRMMVDENLGDSLLAGGRAKEAATAYQRSLSRCDELDAMEQATDDGVFDRLELILKLANSHDARGQFQESQSLFAEGFRLANRAIEAYPMDAQAVQSWVHMRYGLGLATDRLRPDMHDSTYLDECITQQKSAVDLSANSGDALRQLAELYRARGLVTSRGGDPAAAESDFRQATLIIEQALALTPDSALYRYHRCLIRSQLAGALSSLGRQAEAGELVDRNCDQLERLLERDSSNTNWRYLLARDLHRKGTTVRIRGLIRESIQTYERALVLLDGLIGGDPERIEWRRSRGGTRQSIGGSFLALQEPTRALEAYRNALADRKYVVEQSQSPRDWSELGAAYDRLTTVHKTRTEPELAQAMRSESIHWMERAAKATQDPADHRRLWVFRGRAIRAAFYEATGLEQRRASIVEFGSVVAFRRRHSEEYPSVFHFGEDYAVGLDQIGEMHAMVGAPDPALEAWIESLAIARKLSQQQPTNAKPIELEAHLLQHLAQVAARRNLPGVAIEHFIAARAVRVTFAKKQDSLSAWESASRGAVSVARTIEQFQAKLGTDAKQQQREAWQSLLEIRHAIIALDPDNHQLRGSAGWAAARVADAEFSLGHWERAVATLREVEQLRTRILETRPSDGTYRDGVVWAQDRITEVLRSKERTRGLVEHCRRVVFERERLRDLGVEWADQLAFAYAARAGASGQAGNYLEATTDWQRAVAELSKIDPAPDGTAARLEQWEGELTSARQRAAVSGR